MNDINKKYNVRYLFDIRRLYYFLKVHPVGAFLSMSHYHILFSLKDKNEINYYINQTQSRNLSKRDLQRIIKDNEYERLDEATKIKTSNYVLVFLQYFNLKLCATNTFAINS